MAKLNCWEVKKCGRETGGARAAELGVCSSYTETKFNRVHGGENAGRACWVVGGTLCGGKVQGTYADKIKNCLECDFYQFVRNEEGRAFKPLSDLLKILKA